MIATFVEVWTAVVAFVTGLFSEITGIFYVAETGLTFLGTLALISAGIGILLTIFSLIRSFIGRSKV